MNSIKVNVKNGPAHVNSIHLMASGPGVWVFSADLKAKHAVVGPLSGQTVMVDVNEGTLYPAENPANEFTIIEFEGLPSRSYLDATISGYTLHIFIYEMKEWYGDDALVWQAPPIVPFYRSGDRVLVDGEVEAKVAQYFPEGSTSLMSPHVVVNFKDGDKNVKVALNRIKKLK